MALAITHFAFGFTLGYVSRNTTVAWVCGLLALVPDLNQLWPGLDTVLFQSPWSNLFFLHGIYDSGSADTNPVVSATVILAVATVFVIYFDSIA